MAKERMMAIVIGGLMLFSVAGFAFMGVGRFGRGNENQQSGLQTIMNEYLTSEQVAGILRTGRVVIRDVYANNCTSCIITDAELKLFANQFSGYIVLEQVAIEPDNTTIVDENGYIRFEMLSPTGEIIALGDEEISQENLIEIFCDISAVQPRDCMLRDIAPIAQPTTEPDAGNETLNDTAAGINGSAGTGINKTNGSEGTV